MRWPWRLGVPEHSMDGPRPRSWCMTGTASSPSPRRPSSAWPRQCGRARTEQINSPRSHRRPISSPATNTLRPRVGHLGNPSSWAAGLWVRLFDAKQEATERGGPQLELLTTEIRLRQLQTSAPDRQSDHQPRGDGRGPADIDGDRLGARRVRPSGGRRDVRAGHQLSRRGPSGGLNASARPPCRPAGRRSLPLLPGLRPLPVSSSPSAASAIARPAPDRRTLQALRRSRLR